MPVSTAKKLRTNEKELVSNQKRNNYVMIQDDEILVVCQYNIAAIRRLLIAVNALFARN